MLIVLLLVAGWPLFRTITLSFTDERLQADFQSQWVGFDNYLYNGPERDAYDRLLNGYFINAPDTDEVFYYPPDDAFYSIDDAFTALDEGAFAAAEQAEQEALDAGASQEEAAAAFDEAYDTYQLQGSDLEAINAQPIQGIDRDSVFRWQGVLVDPLWWRSVWNTVVFSVVSVFFEMVLGIIIALVLNANLPGRGVLRAAVLIPWAIPTIVSAQMWGWMLNDQYGVFNEILISWGWIEERVAFTAERALALPAVIAVDVWKTTPFMALLVLAALQLLPGEVYEAAKVDGIHPVRAFFRITLPLIRPALMVAVIFRALDALRIFDLIYVLTSGSRDTMSMSVYARQNLVDFQDVGYGSALSTALFIIIAGFTVIYIALGRVNLGQER
jgi:trehalose/maltose transport system permease protein